MNMEFLIETQLANRVTNRTRKVFDIASRLAAVSVLRVVDTNHLLLGCFREGTGVAFHVLDHFAVSQKSLEAVCGLMIEPNNESMLANEFDDEVRVAFDAAVDALRLLGHNYFGTEHLLIGLTTSGLKSSQSLQRLGKEPQLLRNEVFSLLGCKELA